MKTQLAALLAILIAFVPLFARSAGSFPQSVAGIEVTEANGKRCGAVVISPMHLITPAHCVSVLTGSEATPVRVINKEQVFVRTAAGRMNVHNITIHPGYLKAPLVRRSWYSVSWVPSDWDMAILTLRESLLQRPFAVDTRTFAFHPGTLLETVWFSDGRYDSTTMKIDSAGAASDVALIESYSLPEKESPDGAVILAMDPHSDGSLIWGVKIGEEDGKARIVRMHRFTPWLLGEIQKDLATLFAPLNCSSPVIASTKKVKTPKVERPPLELPEFGPILQRRPDSARMAPKSLGAPRAPEIRHNVIFGGQLVPDDSPLLKSVVLVRGTTSICSGTLISPYHVVTAGHCFDAADLQARRTHKAIFYSTASYDEEAIASAKVTRHPIYTDEAKTQKRYFHGITEQSDIAILTLEKPAPRRAKPMLLVPFATEFPKGSEIQVAGFGLQGFDDKAKSGDLKVTTMKVHDWGRSSEIYVTAIDNSGILSGDSGGAALQFSSKNEAFLWGVITRSQTIKVEEKIVGATAVRIFDHGNWIFSIIQKDLFDHAEKNANGCGQ